MTGAGYDSADPRRTKTGACRFAAVLGPGPKTLSRGDVGRARCPRAALSARAPLKWCRPMTNGCGRHLARSAVSEAAPPWVAGRHRGRAIGRPAVAFFQPNGRPVGPASGPERVGPRPRGNAGRCHDMSRRARGGRYRRGWAAAHFHRPGFLSAFPGSKSSPLSAGSGGRGRSFSAARDGSDSARRGCRPRACPPPQAAEKSRVGCRSAWAYARRLPDTIFCCCAHSAARADGGFNHLDALGSWVGGLARGNGWRHVQIWRS